MDTFNYILYICISINNSLKNNTELDCIELHYTMLGLFFNLDTTCVKFVSKQPSSEWWITERSEFNCGLSVNVVVRAYDSGLDK